MLDLSTLLCHSLSSTSKGIPDSLDGSTIEDVPKRRLNILRDSFPAPVAVIRESAMRTNIALMREYTESVGVGLAPHGKTTMSPQLFDLQLRAGAWGMTCATAAHLRLYRQFRVPRIIMANQLLDADSVRFVARELARDPAFEFYGIVDSVEGVRQYREALARESSATGGLPPGRVLNLLLEVGASGGRTGARTVEAALAVAREVANAGGGGGSDVGGAARARGGAASGPRNGGGGAGTRGGAGASRPHDRSGNPLRLAGIEAFEGIFPGTPREAEVSVQSFMQKVSEVARLCDEERLFGVDTILLTAGGSAYFDQVASSLRAVRLSRPTQVILRSGCYITHDHGTYAAALDRLRERSSDGVFKDRSFEPAIEIWTTVQSIPEPGLAIITLGKRDVSFDLGLPVPLKVSKPGAVAGITPPADIRGKAEIIKLNDHHGYLRFTDLDLAVQDRVAVGISHPCTTFDRWEYLYVTDDQYNVNSIIRTFF